MFRIRKNNFLPLDPDEILADSTSSLNLQQDLEGKLERSLGRTPALFFIFLIAAALLYLAGRAAILTLKYGEAMLTASKENRFLIRPIFAERGLIYDRFGKELAKNIPTFTLLLEKQTFRIKGGNLTEILKRIAEISAHPPLWEIPREDAADLNSGEGEMVLARNLDLETVVAISARSEEFPGLKIAESFRRSYAGPAHAHVLGYTGQISSQELQLRPELKGEESVGKTGIEAFYDQLLRGKRGKKIIEVDSRGRETRYRLTEEPQPGSVLTLTIDKELEEQVYQTLLKHLPDQKKGASVVIEDPRNGQVLTLVSYPSVDTNNFGAYLDPRDFLKIVQDPLTPLFNRAISGEFPSGSTIKPFLAAAALEENLIDPQKKIYDAGFIEIPNPYRPTERSIFRDWKEHGWINFYDAIAQSANVYFYMIGGGYQNQEGLGIERIKKYLSNFGFGQRLGIDLPGEKSGLLPDPELKKNVEPNDPIWRLGDTYNTSIGQGWVKVTPLQLTTAVAALSNGGKVWRPYLNLSSEPQLIRQVPIKKENLAQVLKGMRLAVTSGTARLLSGLPVPAAAKTGTAQSGSGLPHAWVTAFAPVENPQVVITVMVEHAGEGSTVAVPITYEILQWYFENRR